MIVTKPSLLAQKKSAGVFETEKFVVPTVDKIVNINIQSQSTNSKNPQMKLLSKQKNEKDKKQFIVNKFNLKFSGKNNGARLERMTSPKIRKADPSVTSSPNNKRPNSTESFETESYASPLVLKNVLSTNTGTETDNSPWIRKKQGKPRLNNIRVQPSIALEDEAVQNLKDLESSNESIYNFVSKNKAVEDLIKKVSPSILQKQAKLNGVVSQQKRYNGIRLKKRNMPDRQQYKFDINLVPTDTNQIQTLADYPNSGFVIGQPIKPEQKIRDLHIDDVHMNPVLRRNITLHNFNHETQESFHLQTQETSIDHDDFKPKLAAREQAQSQYGDTHSVIERPSAPKV